MIRKTVKLLVDHCKMWNGWRKNCKNSKARKLAVLFGANSPSFDFYKFDKFLEMQRNLKC